MIENKLSSDRTVHELDARGTVRDWLVSPVWSEPADDLDSLVAADGSPWGPNGRWVLTNGPDVSPLKSRLYDRRRLRADQEWSESEVIPAEGAAVEYIGPTGIRHTGPWQRRHTADDGLVDASEFCFTPSYRLVVSACVVEVDQAEWRTLRIACTGPTMTYVDGEMVDRDAGFSYMEPVEREIRVWLPSGLSTIRIASWQVAFRECRQVLRLRIGGLPVRVVVPSPGADEFRSSVAERILDQVGIGGWAIGSDRTAELTGPDGAALRVRWPGGDRRIRLTGGRAAVQLTASNPDEVAGGASMLSTGEITLTVGMDDDRVPVFREFPVAVLPPAYRPEPVGEPADWRTELLEHVDRTQSGGAAGELSRWVLAAERGLDHKLTYDSLDDPLWMIENRADCADFEAVGLVHLLRRIPADSWPAELRARVDAALLGFKYWIDQPGLDAMCYFTENHQLVWHTAEMLVGELYDGQRFGNTGWDGARHAEHGRELAREWITRKLRGGFSEFDSNAYLAIDTLALVSIVEYATDRALARLATALLDKVLFTLGCNSWRGIHGSAHGRSYVRTVRSSRFEETAPIMWVCWGTGALNHAVLPATVVATARRYRIPPAIRTAAQSTSTQSTSTRPTSSWSTSTQNQPDEWVGWQHYRGEYRYRHDLLSRPYSSDLLVYKTPAGMLSSVRDYRSGLPGLQEHIWGATIGPETQVYVTHAPNAATHSSARPNAWAGNRILPRVRQHANVLLALYRIPPDDPMGYTHGWFPTSTMDEWRLNGSWVVGRRGAGYVALSTMDGVWLSESGPDAGADVRAIGPGTGWVCVLGRETDDGGWDDFVASLGEPTYDVDRIDYRTPAGERLRLTWNGPFLVDGQCPDLDRESGLPVEPDHIDNPLCRAGFDDPLWTVEVDGQRHVIDLTNGRDV